MWALFDHWQFLAGLGIFLFGMHELETSLEVLGGKTFRRYLRTSTNKPIYAVFTGAFSTAILQSSSVVTLMLLAFVGAGIITFQNSIGVVLGANLGTTFTAWLVAIFGFSFKIEAFSLPLIAVGSLGRAFTTSNERLISTFQLIAGFGFLFFGLDYMKSSIDEVAAQLDITQFTGYGNFAFLLVGLVFTAIVQSSSATIVIALSVLNAGLISFAAAGSLVIGANLGTTVTIIIGSLGKGLVAKKRVAFAHLFFNIITAAVAFPILTLMVWFIQDILEVENPLYALTSFHTIFNLIGVALFLPFIKPFARLLERMVKDKSVTVAEYISQLLPNDAEAAIVALEQELEHMMEIVIQLNALALQLSGKGILKPKNEGLPLGKKKKWMEKRSFISIYQDVKKLEVEILHFFAELQKQPINEAEATRLADLMSGIRNLVYSAKSMKDILHNIDELDNIDKVAIQDKLIEIQQFQEEFYHEAYRISIEANRTAEWTDIQNLMQKSKGRYMSFTKQIYQDISDGVINEEQVSTLLRVNREIYNSDKFLMRSISMYSTHKDVDQELEESPAFR
ncbi:Na/Pi cotransporter family protein [Algoriphagus namhaensis]|uniref:Na/Pi cotransporter family protein n=1 Tax=Algoriphagus namhaensis TaxID=915353 RepID=A0ABV8AY46_9BACT